MNIHRSGYFYWYPSPKIIRTGPAIRTKALVILFLWWGCIIELKS